MSKVIAIGLVLCATFFQSCFGQLPRDPDSLRMLLVSSPDTTQHDALIELAWHHIHTQPDSTIYYGKRALDLAESLDDPYRQTKGTNTLGVVYNMLSSHPLALEYFLRTLALNEQIGHQQNVARTLLNISNIFTMREEFSQAQTYLLKALPISQSIKDSGAMMAVYNNLAAVAYGQTKYDSAIQYARQALNIVEKKQGLGAHPEIYNVLGQSHAALRHHAKALFFFRKSLQINQQYEDPGVQTEALGGIAKIHLSKDQTDSAFTYVQQMVQAAQASQLPDATADANILLSRIYQTTGDHSRSLLHYQRATALNDSILNETTSQRIAQMQIVYETQKREQAIKDLQQEKALSTAQAEKERSLRYGILVIVSLLLGLLAMLYNRYRLKQRALRTITEQKGQIEQQNIIITDKNQENEVLLREVHHRVKNNLQLILSLFNIQSRQFDDEAVLDFVRDGQNRVRSMALIHQDLYQAQRLDQIRFDHYLKQLADHLRTVYQTERRSIFVWVRAEPVCLNVNTAVPLGLIINELVSNALKHAFSDDTGRVEISLETRSDQQYTLRVTDDGIGIEKTDSAKTANTMGLNLVRGLVRQLGGTLTMATEASSNFEIVFANKHTITNQPPTVAS